MTDTTQEIKDRLSIVDVVSPYVKLTRAGVNFKTRCPFHAEKTPSFIVSPDRGTYHCFGCGVGGDIFSFVQTIEGIDFKGALKILAEKAGVTLREGFAKEGGSKDRLLAAMEMATLWYERSLRPNAVDYLHRRGLTDETIRSFRIGEAGDGWSDVTDHLRSRTFTDQEIIDAGLAKKGDRGLVDKFRNRIMFPIADSAGRVVAFSGRTFGEKAHPDAPKYLNSPETTLYHKSKILFGYDRAKQLIRKHNCALLVEGQLDLILSHQAGWGNAVAASGTAFTSDHAAILKRMSDNLVIALDADEAGFKAAGRAAHAALRAGLNVKVAELPEGMDPADLISQRGPDAWREAIRGAQDIITFLLDVLSAKAKDHLQLRQRVETIVLPFLSEVQSPIAKEQYEREIARRLGVSESAVRSAEAQIPKPPVPVPTLTRPADAPNRIKQAYGVLLWQESLKAPLIDTEAFARDLAAAIGTDAFNELTKLPIEDKETLRFFAEQLHQKNGSLERSIEMLLKLLERDRLHEELHEAGEALGIAEEQGNDAEVARLSELLRLLTGRIAKLA